MRIIGGAFGGRKINPPARMPYTRPTTDIAKEGLFNIIQSNRKIEGMKTLDLFGGTGSISFELASRGAADLSIVEKNQAMEAFIRETAEKLELTNLKVFRSDVFRFLKATQDKYDFIFAGPPYALETIDHIPEIIVQENLLKKNGWFVLEHTTRSHYENFPFFATERNYGTTFFSIFINKS
ncbi:MAG: RsmD family RNA methyltransferase [Bacteroidota bacterium]|nr:RsmD family RNA methyltransferase [Bacteroidota bacterium]MDP4251746.1 RsmD family RNA methyltransferase [Bacteroidota bacterium]